MFCITNIVLKRVLALKYLTKINVKKCYNFDIKSNNLIINGLNVMRGYHSQEYDLIDTLNIDKFIEYLENQNTVFKDGSDLTLLRDKYVSEETLKLLNVKINSNEKMPNISVDTKSDNIFKELSFSGNESEFCKLIKSIHISEEKKESNEQNVETFVDIIMKRLKFDCNPFQLERDLVLDFQISVDEYRDSTYPFASRPDFIVKLIDTKAVIFNICIKGLDSEEDFLFDESQTVVQLIANANYNRSLCDENSFAVFSLLIRGLNFYIYSTKISTQYLDQLKSEKEELTKKLIIKRYDGKDKGLNYESEEERDEIHKFLNLMTTVPQNKQIINKF